MSNLFGGFFKRLYKPQETHSPSVLKDFSDFDKECIVYCIEQKQTIEKLESGLCTNDDPEVIAKKALTASLLH